MRGPKRDDIWPSRAARYYPVYSCTQPLQTRDLGRKKPIRRKNRAARADCTGETPPHGIAEPIRRRHFWLLASFRRGRGKLDRLDVWVDHDLRHRAAMRCDLVPLRRRRWLNFFLL